jgi:hypothetical protein
VIVLGVLFAPVVLPAGAGENPRISLQDGVLSVEARAVALSTLLYAIGEDAGFEVNIDGDLETPTDASFSGLPLVQGLKRLLDRSSYLMFFDDSKNLRELRVLAASAGGASPSPQPAVTFTEEPTQADLESWIRDRLASTEQGDRIVAVRKLGGLDRDVALDMTATILQSDPDPVVRGEAVAMLAKIGGERIASLLGTAMNDADASVRRRAIPLWQTLGSEQAVPALGRVLSEDPDNGVRLSALQVLIAINDAAARYYIEQARSDQDESIRRAADRVFEASETVAPEQSGDGAGGVQLPDASQTE